MTYRFKIKNFDIIRFMYEKEVKTTLMKLKERYENTLSKKELAIRLARKRVHIGMKYKYLRNEAYREQIYQRNLEKYGNKYGATWDYLCNKYNHDYGLIIEKSMSTNKNYNELRKKFEEV